MARQTHAYLGSGMVKMREVGAQTAFLAIGNCSALTFGSQVESKELKNYTKPGGGTYAKVDRISSVTVNLTCHDLDGPNLARASGGAVSTSVAGSVSAEALVAYPGGTTPTSKPPSAVTSVTAPGGTPIYAAGTDYLVTPGGIEVLASGTIPAPVANAANVAITYDNTALTVVQALVNSGKEYELLFEGLNEAESDLPVVVRAFRVKFAPAQAINFLGDDFAALELTGTALSDGNLVGAGVSQYWMATIVE